MKKIFDVPIKVTSKAQPEESEKEMVVGDKTGHSERSQIGRRTGGWSGSGTGQMSGGRSREADADNSDLQKSISVRSILDT